MESIFDIKTLRVDNNHRYYAFHNDGEHKRATDIKMKDVRRDYTRRSEKLDIKCTNDDGTPPLLGSSKYEFQSGGAHPLVFGAYGKTNEETRAITLPCEKLLHQKKKILMPL